MLSKHVTAGINFVAANDADADSAVEFCCEKLKLPEQELNPAPLVDGKTLHKIGVASGPQFSRLIRQVRAMQLDGELATVEEAVKWVEGSKE